MFVCVCVCVCVHMLHEHAARLRGPPHGRRLATGRDKEPHKSQHETTVSECTLERTHTHTHAHTHAHTHIIHTYSLTHSPPYGVRQTPALIRAHTQSC